MTDYKFKYNKPTPLSTSRLVPDNGFLSGAGSVFNLGGQNFDYNYSNSDTEADCSALRRDWDIIGNDIRTVFGKIVNHG